MMSLVGALALLISFAHAGSPDEERLTRLREALGRAFQPLGSDYEGVVARLIRGLAEETERTHACADAIDPRLPAPTEDELKRVILPAIDADRIDALWMSSGDEGERRLTFDDAFDFIRPHAADVRFVELVYRTGHRVRLKLRDDAFQFLHVPVRTPKAWEQTLTKLLGRDGLVLSHRTSAARTLPELRGYAVVSISLGKGGQEIALANLPTAPLSLDHLESATFRIPGFGFRYVMRK